MIVFLELAPKGWFNKFRLEHLVLVSLRWGMQFTELVSKSYLEDLFSRIFLSFSRGGCKRYNGYKGSWRSDTGEGEKTEREEKHK